MNLPKPKNLALPFFIVLFILISSCKKDVEINSSLNGGLMGTIEYYYNVATPKIDGQFIFESNLSNNDSSLAKIAMTIGAFYDKQGNIINNGGRIAIGNLFLKNHDGTFFVDSLISQKELYGLNITFSIQLPPDTVYNPASNITTTFYSPLPISITNIKPSTPLTLKTGSATTLTWNADPGNVKGVVIMAEYIPSRSVNRNIASAGATRLIEKSQLVPDNGNVSLPWDFFSEFPTGGHVSLWIARGNFNIISRNNYKYKVGGYTATAIWDCTVF